MPKVFGSINGIIAKSASQLNAPSEVCFLPFETRKKADTSVTPDTAVSCKLTGSSVLAEDVRAVRALCRVHASVAFSRIKARKRIMARSHPI